MLRKEPATSDTWPQLVMVGMFSGVSAVGVFSAYHEKLGRALPEATMVGGLLGTGAAAILAAQSAANSQIQMQWTFLGLATSLGAVYALMNKYLEKTEVAAGDPTMFSSVAPPAMSGLAVTVAAAAVAAAYWKS